MTGDAIEFTNQQLTEQIEDLKKELGEQKHLAEERLNQIHYLQADFDNFRRWSEKERGSIVTLANEHLIGDLLVILDDFDRALPALEQEENRQGIQMIQKKLVKILNEYGLQPIECMGKRFDPNLHEVLCKERCDKEPDTIIEEIGKGYHLKSKVIRPSKVKISEKNSGTVGEQNE
ncbi:nucleotide exchange factor GrpE [Methanosphaerula palustris]|uniref:Protein GrpE n=1 Tax=Methanosphaerula palustris (strain ATCC BAA-1556 / DSM 19958 / E1-9c) TaxID=521011 RepID=B8GIW3_METPE|nr:nucleotide exchange factor GrpE [Methanosphaerula palustris]ACL16926.1 GrpE protein [Methanosphaerula palustris E1-9c]